MGLGPPVCCECKTILLFRVTPEANQSHWYCPKHGEINEIKYKHLFRYPENEMFEIEKRSYGHSITEDYLSKSKRG